MKLFVTLIASGDGREEIFEIEHETMKSENERWIHVIIVIDNASDSDGEALLRIAEKIKNYDTSDFRKEGDIFSFDFKQKNEKGQSSTIRTVLCLISSATIH